MNALENALGIRFQFIPITPDMILAAIHGWACEGVFPL